MAALQKPEVGADDEVGRASRPSGVICIASLAKLMQGISNSGVLT